jgi:hypothetical protein
LLLRKHFGTILSVSPSNAAVASSPKLLDRVRWHLRVKHYSIRTEQAYVDWIRRYILFHHKRHPNELAEKEITDFLTYLAASTQNQAFAALLFLYQQVLDRKIDFIDNVERVKRPAKLPVVFTPAEARPALAQLKGDYRLMAELLYGSGLRLMECLRLRIKDIDWATTASQSGTARACVIALRSCRSDCNVRSAGKSPAWKSYIDNTSPTAAEEFICRSLWSANTPMPRAN